MAKGGEILPFCDTDRHHVEGCQYFAGGGISAPAFIPDSQFTPDQGAPQDSQDAPNPNPTFIPDDQFESDGDRYGTLGQQAKTAAEGVAEGVLGPIAPMIEKKLGVKPEDMRARAEENPWTHGLAEGAGFAGSMATGLGEGALVSHLGEGVAHAAGLGLEGASTLNKLGAGATRAGAEMALISGGDEVSKMIKEDPNQSFGSAVTNVGLSGLLGVAGGAALGSVSPLWKATAGEKAGQFLEDFRGRFKERLEMPNPIDSLTQELSDLHGSITNVADEVYGPNGLKNQEIQKVIPGFHEKMATQATDIASKVQGTLDEMAAKPDVYPEHLTSRLSEDFEKYKNAATNAKSSGEIFSATQDLKNSLQQYSKYDKFVKPVDEAYGFVNKAKQLNQDIRSALEDSDVWGKAADRQQAVKKAFHDYLPALQDFEKKFTTVVNGEKVIDPGRVSAFVKQLGKPNAEISQQVLENFVKATEKYKQVLGDTHANLGLDNPFEAKSMNAIKGALKDVPAGAKAADILIDRGIANVAGHSLGAGVGELIGHSLGIPGIGGIIGERALGPFFSSILPALAKPIIENPGFADGFKSAVDYGISITRGEKAIGNAAKNIFKSGAEVIPATRMPSEKDRTRLNDELVALQKDPNAMMKVGGSIAHYLPAHGTAIAASTMNVVNYLNGLRPKEIKNSPLDEPFESPFQKDRYDSALNIAQQPLVVLQHLKEGILVPEAVTDLKTMYPSLYGSLCSRIHEQMIDHLSKDESISYQTQLGLSLFLGQPLESTISQPSIAAAQMAQNRTAAQEQAKQMGAQAPKGKSMKALNKLPEHYATAGQARQAQQQNPKV